MLHDFKIELWKKDAYNLHLLLNAFKYLVFCFFFKQPDRKKYSPNRQFFKSLTRPIQTDDTSFASCLQFRPCDLSDFFLLNSFIFFIETTTHIKREKQPQLVLKLVLRLAGLMSLHLLPNNVEIIKQYLKYVSHVYLLPTLNHKYRSYPLPPPYPTNTTVFQITCQHPLTGSSSCWTQSLTEFHVVAHK